MKLNKDQHSALVTFKKWYRDYSKPNKCVRQWFEISGAAGTGKTTLAKYLFESVGIDNKSILFVAYIGKAAMVLSRNGLRAKTIHSTIYDVIFRVTKKDDGTYKRTMEFMLKESLPSWVKGIVVDEGSMVPEDIAMDLLSYGIPVIVLGDLNQLPPVMGRSVFLKHPDAILTMIMRQEADSPIIRLSQDILNGKRIPLGKYDDRGLVEVVTDRKPLELDFKSYDAIIVGKNNTREMYNKYLREQVYNLKGKLKIGDKIICRKNNWNYTSDKGTPLTNGLTGIVDDIFEEYSTSSYYSIDFQPDGMSDMFYDVHVDRAFLEMPIGYAKKGGLGFLDTDVFEYAYAITCHLAQGSQYNNIYVKTENLGSPSFCKRWLYTAVTRAIERVTLVI